MFAEKIIRNEIRSMDSEIHFCSLGLGYRIFTEKKEEEDDVIALLMKHYPDGSDVENAEDRNAPTNNTT